MKGRVTATRPAGKNHQVVTVVGGAARPHMQRPCPRCPWRVDATGEFPAEAFRHSASTSYDMAESVFSCHEAGMEAPRTCAGFLLRGAEHNLAVRLGTLSGRYDLTAVTDGGHELHASYRAMAIANGVSPSDPILAPCRSGQDGEFL
ncbi:hypothetical protein IHN63_01690 [Deinococcus sp. 6YEL10]|nr:hypothetical protein [Deinococcus sp. 6YEL10]